MVRPSIVARTRCESSVTDRSITNEGLDVAISKERDHAAVRTRWRTSGSQWDGLPHLSPCP